MFSGNQNVNNGVLGKFDSSVLQNGSYVVKLTAIDKNGLVNEVEDVIDVAGELKLGNFRLSFTDLSIPVSGIPISVTRSYDSLNANSKDDFGYGWRLEFRDTDLRTSLKKDEVNQELGISTVPFKDKTRVYITLPGGKREAFTFKPSRDRLSGFLQAAAPPDVDAGIYHPAFVGDKGVTSKLSVVDTRLSHVGNEYYDLGGTPYNPADSYFGGKYVLTTKDGIVYEIDGVSGDLLTATDTNGNKVTFTDAGIFSDSGKAISFGRDAKGRIVSVTDLLGKQVKYQYDAKGDLVGVTDRENNTTQFVYNSPQWNHFLTEVIDPLGRRGVRNEYDDKGRLKKLFDADNNAVELIHDPNNFVETVKDVFGKATTYEYDSRGNILTEVDALGKMMKRSYDDDNNMLSETVITPETGTAGWKTEFTYDGEGNKLTEKDPLGNITRYTYGAFGRLLTETDPLGNTTTNRYSKSGNLLASFDAAGNVTEYSYDIKGNLLNFTDANKKVTKFKYDSFGNVESVLDALNNETIYTYDGNGNRKSETKKVTISSGIQSLVTKWDYDNSGKVKFLTDAENKVTEYQYDKNGHQIAVVDALLRKTESRYDDKGQLIETIYPDKTADLSDNPRTINLYDKGGRKRGTIDQSGRVTHYRYDDAGQLIETIYPKVTDTLNQLISVISPTQTIATIDWTKVVYPDETPTYLATNSRSKTEYYKTGQVKAQVDERGNRTEYRYNAKGEQIETIYPDNTPNTLSDNPRTSSKYDSSGRLTDSIDPQGRITSYKYDSLSRLTETIYPDNTPNNISDNPTTKTEYDKLGRKVAAIDQNGKITRYEYDDIGQLTDVVQVIDASVEVRTEYGYDEANRLVWIEDANDHRTKYEYGKNGRRIATELPLGKKSYTTYDAVGNIYTTTDFNGDSISYQYDEQNRLIKKEFSTASGIVPVTFTYTPSGQIDKIIDARGTTTFKYDERNRLISRTDPNGVYLASGNTLEYGYDVAGNRTEVRTPNGNVSYTYDEQNRLKTVTSSQGTTTYFYDVAGNLVKTELPNGVVETRDYDELNRLKLVKNVKDGVGISSFDYTLDLVGHRRVVSEQNGRKVEYEYDSLYRLTKETITDAVAGNRVVEYTYDKVGNRLTKNDSVEGITTYTYDDNDRLKMEELNQNNVVVQTIEYRYDDNGNLKSRIKNGVEEVSYTWDKENRLIGVIKASGEVISYQYDSDGIRVSSTVNGVKTEFLVDKNLPYAQVLEERVNNGLTAGYVYGNDLISQQRGSEKSFYLVDGLGSTRGLTNAGGVVTDTYAYDAFGNLISSTNNVQNNYLFAGEQFDRSLGDYYLRARYYDESIGRFTRRDTWEGFLSNPVSLHKYIYTHNNPVNLTDSSGLTPLTDVVLGFRRVGLYSFLNPIYAYAQFGGIVHRAIEADILQKNARVQTEVTVQGGRIDVLYQPNEIFDIKPLDGVVDPNIQLDRYIRMNPDRNFVKGTFMFEGRLDNPPPLIGTSLTYYTAEPGVIVYYPFMNKTGLAMIATTLFSTIAASNQQQVSQIATQVATNLSLTKGFA
nr:RHS repeat-associated core domain-containing protein [Argonema antarcticum]